jgi:succinate--hydroxymethylglutarate CoA-transferase
MIEDITSSKLSKEWLDIFEGTGLAYAKINDIKDTLEHSHGMWHSVGGDSNTDDDEIVVARDMIKEIQHPACGQLKVLNSPVKYSRTQPSIRTPPPLLGEHTNEVLRDVLGLDSAEIERLRENKAVGG